MYLRFKISSEVNIQQREHSKFISTKNIPGANCLTRGSQRISTTLSNQEKSKIKKTITFIIYADNSLIIFIKWRIHVNFN